MREAKPLFYLLLLFLLLDAFLVVLWFGERFVYEGFHPLIPGDTRNTGLPAGIGRDQPYLSYWTVDETYANLALPEVRLVAEGRGCGPPSFPLPCPRGGKKRPLPSTSPTPAASAWSGRRAVGRSTASFSTAIPSSTGGQRSRTIEGRYTSTPSYRETRVRRASSSLRKVSPKCSQTPASSPGEKDRSARGRLPPRTLRRKGDAPPDRPCVAGDGGGSGVRRERLSRPPPAAGGPLRVPEDFRTTLPRRFSR